MQGLKNYYQILQIPSNASSLEVQQAYQKLSAFWHPDKHRNDRRNAQYKFHAISQAYETLSNRNKRSHYDELLNRQFTVQDATKTFQRFYDQFGFENQNQKKFFEQNYPSKKRNYYDVLQVSRNASFQDIKKAYRRLAIQYHPKNNPGSEQANKRFVQVNQAFNALSNEGRRQNYDDLVFQRNIAPLRAHDIFEDFWVNRPYDMPPEQQFFKPILKKKWSNTLDRLMDNQQSWKDVSSGETVKTSTVYTVDNGVETKKTVTTKRKIENGIPVTTTTQEYDFPNGTKEIRKIKDDGKGNITTDVFNLKKGENLPIGF